MKIRIFCLLVTSTFILSGITSRAQVASSFHQKTAWRLKPSFKFDLLCLLNTLSNDSFYLKYYSDEFEHFKDSLPPRVQNALKEIKRKVKEENKGIISAFTSLYFSAVSDSTIDQMLATLKDPDKLKANMQRTVYYNDKSWRLFNSIRKDLTIVLSHLHQINFYAYWSQYVQPKVIAKIDSLRPLFSQYNVVKEVETMLGYPLQSDTITVYFLYFSRPHGIKITGTSFLTDIAWPFEIVVRNAVHEMMHPPFHLATQASLKEALESLKEDDFLMDKVLHHNPSLGYNTFEGFIEEDCIQAIEQYICEKMGIAKPAAQRWRDSDEGMHVFAVVLYQLLKEHRYEVQNETFATFLERMIRTKVLVKGIIRQKYETFYAQ